MLHFILFAFVLFWILFVTLVLPEGSNMTVPPLILPVYTFPRVLGSLSVVFRLFQKVTRNSLGPRKFGAGNSADLTFIILPLKRLR